MAELAFIALSAPVSEPAQTLIAHSTVDHPNHHTHGRDEPPLQLASSRATDTQLVSTRDRMEHDLHQPDDTQSSLECQNISFTPKRMLALPRAWERRPTASSVVRTEGQQEQQQKKVIWKRLPLGELTVDTNQTAARREQREQKEKKDYVRVVKKMKLSVPSSTSTPPAVVVTGSRGETRGVGVDPHGEGDAGIATSTAASATASTAISTTTSTAESTTTSPAVSTTTSTAISTTPSTAASTTTSPAISTCTDLETDEELEDSDKENEENDRANKKNAKESKQNKKDNTTSAEKPNAPQKWNISSDFAHARLYLATSVSTKVEEDVIEAGGSPKKKQRVKIGMCDIRNTVPETDCGTRIELEESDQTQPQTEGDEAGPARVVLTNEQTIGGIFAVVQPETTSTEGETEEGQGEQGDAIGKYARCAEAAKADRDVGSGDVDMICHNEATEDSSTREETEDPLEENVSLSTQGRINLQLVESTVLTESADLIQITAHDLTQTNEYDETAFLKDFLVRARAQKAARDAVSANMDDMTETEWSSSDDRTVTLEHAVEDDNLFSGTADPGLSLSPQRPASTEDENNTSPLRRSSRVATKSSTHLPQLHFLPPKIHLKRATGNEFVFVANQAQSAPHVALQTRTNTKRNKGDSLCVTDRLQLLKDEILNSSQSTEPGPDENGSVVAEVESHVSRKHKKSVRKSKKTLRWNDACLVTFSESIPSVMDEPETLDGSSQDEATPTAVEVAVLAEKSTAPVPLSISLQGQGTEQADSELKNASTKKKSERSERVEKKTSKVRHARHGIAGTVNGTPAPKTRQIMFFDHNEGTDTKPTLLKSETEAEVVGIADAAADHDSNPKSKPKSEQVEDGGGEPDRKFQTGSRGRTTTNRPSATIQKSRMPVPVSASSSTNSTSTAMAKAKVSTNGVSTTTTGSVPTISTTASAAGTTPATTAITSGRPPSASTCTDRDRERERETTSSSGMKARRQQQTVDSAFIVASTFTPTPTSINSSTLSSSSSSSSLSSGSRTSTVPTTTVPRRNLRARS